MWGTIISGIISAVFGAGASIWTQSEQNKATAAAGREAKNLAMLNRSDVLAENAAGRRITLKELAQRKKEADAANRIAKGNLAINKGTLELNKQQFAQNVREYDNEQIRKLAEDITKRANSDPSYKTQLLQFWGA
jgi:hypothetical protein